MTQRNLMETDPLTPRDCKNGRLLILIAAVIAIPIPIVIVLACIGPYIGAYLPPSLASSVNLAVFWYILIIGVAIAAFAFMILLISVPLVLFPFFVLFILPLLVFGISDSLTPLAIIDEIADRSIGEPIAHYPVTEGLVNSSAHRAAIEMDCNRGSLRKRVQSDFHEHAKLKPPKEYEGRYVDSVSGETSDSRHGQVVVVFRESSDRSAWPLDIALTDAGDTLVWEGTCTPQGMYWLFSASLPRAYRRGDYSSQWWLPG